MNKYVKIKKQLEGKFRKKTGIRYSMEQNLVGSLLRELRWISPMCFSTLYHSTPLSITLCYVLTPLLGQDPLKITVPPRPYTMRQRWFPKEESGADTEKRKNECLVGKIKQGGYKRIETFPSSYRWLSVPYRWAIKNQIFSPTLNFILFSISMCYY